MTQLEQTIISNARMDLAAVLVYYGQKAAGIGAAQGEDAWLDYLGRYNAMNALLMLAHQADSGMTDECVQALLAIENEHAAAYRVMTD